MTPLVDRSVLIITPSALYRVIASYNFFSVLYTHYGVNGCCSGLIVYVMSFSLPNFVGILFSNDVEFQCQFVLDDYNFHL